MSTTFTKDSRTASIARTEVLRTPRATQLAGMLTAVGLGIALACPAQAADGAPAVSAPNAKLQLTGGRSGNDSVSAFGGSLSIPVGHYFGAQVDGITGSVAGQSAKGGALHLFTRNPDSYLIGLTGTMMNYRGIDVNRVGVSGELYRNAWTVGIGGGRQTGTLVNADYYHAHLRYYPLPDLAITAAADGYDKTDRYSMAAEWQVKPDWTVGIEGGAGDGDNYLLASVRFYLGEDKSLVRRQREDDPENLLPQSLSEIKNGVITKAESRSTKYSNMDK